MLIHRLQILRSSDGTFFFLCLFIYSYFIYCSPSTPSLCTASGGTTPAADVSIFMAGHSASKCDTLRKVGAVRGAGNRDCSRHHESKSG